MRPDTLFVIGLGPLGGSVAWGAAQGGVPRVIGYDRVRGDAVQALKAGAVQAIADRLDDGLREAQLVVIAEGGPELLSRLAPRLRADAFVTTLTQVAAPAAAAARTAGLAARWAASHLLTLPSGEGFEGARADALRGVVVSVTTTGDESTQAGSEVMHFWESVYEAEAVRMTVAEHDRRIAWMEQLPRLLAALGGDALAHGPLGGATVGGAAARLTALVGPEGAASGMLANQDALREALSGAATSLDILRHLVDHGDLRGLTAFLRGERR